eukprot:250944-Pyramimonas_sp.AAC.1
MRVLNPGGGLLAGAARRQFRERGCALAIDRLQETAMETAGHNEISFALKASNANMGSSLRPRLRRTSLPNAPSEMVPNIGVR